MRSTCVSNVSRPRATATGTYGRASRCLVSNRPSLGQKVERLTEDVHGTIAPAVARLQRVHLSIDEVRHLASVWEAEREGLMLKVESLRAEVAVLRAAVEECLKHENGQRPSKG
jgi:hypothetical protein